MSDDLTTPVRRQRRSHAWQVAPQIDTDRPHPPGCRRLRAGVGGLALALLVPGLLAGCSPRFNWREVRVDEAGYRVMFPDKPDAATRPIHLEDLPVDMTLQGARVDGMTFVVGTVRLSVPALAEGLPADATASDVTASDVTAPRAVGTEGSSTAASAASSDAALGALRTRALEAMRAQMVRNIKGHEVRAAAASVGLIDRAGQAVGSTDEAMAVEAIGERPARKNATGSAAPPRAADELRLLGRFVGRGDHVYQVVVLGPSIDSEQAATFLDSFKLLR